VAHALALNPQVARWCRATFGTRVRIGPSGDDGRVEVELRGHSERSLAAEVAGFGTWLEVVDPPEVRRYLADLGRVLAATYSGPPGAGLP
jgi:predicted DNA-binding transcriptional regulator YafY